MKGLRLGVLTRWIASGDAGRRLWRRGGWQLLALAACALSLPTLARAEPTKVSVELNKLEPVDKSCRAYFVVANEGAADFDSLKLDLVLFQPDGVIGRRVLVNLAPLKAQKRVVKQFDLDGTPCDQLGSLLINEIVECKAAGAPVDDCLGGLTVKSLAKVQLSK